MSPREKLAAPLVSQWAVFTLRPIRAAPGLWIGQVEDVEVITLSIASGLLGPATAASPAPETLGAPVASTAEGGSKSRQTHWGALRAIRDSTLGPSQLLVLVAVALAFGGAVAAVRVGRQLGENVVHMSHREGFNANVVTAVLVGAGADLGLPMSMTQVSTGAISGIAGNQIPRLNVRSLRNVLIAWTATPAVAGGIPLLVFLAIRQT